MVKMNEWKIDKDSIFTVDLFEESSPTIEAPTTNLDCKCLNLKQPVKLLCYPFIKDDKVVDTMLLQL